MNPKKRKVLIVCPICDSPVLVMLYAEEPRGWICDECAYEGRITTLSEEASGEVTWRR